MQVSDLVQDGYGAVKGLSPAEHVMFSSSKRPDPELSCALASELDAPAEIDALRRLTVETRGI